MSPEAKTPVSCDNFESRVNDVLDQRQSPREDASISDHARRCPPCNQLLREYCAVEDSVKLLKGDIESLLARPFDSRHRQRYHRVLSVCAIAAAVLLGCFLLIPGPDRFSDDDVAMLLIPPRYEKLENANLNRSKSDSWFGENLFSRLAESQSAAAYPTFSLDQFLTFDQEAISQFGAQFPLGSVIRISSELPGVRPVQGTMNIAIEYFRRQLDKPKAERDPDLGSNWDSWHMLAAV